jgi:hypothetical protein
VTQICKPGKQNKAEIKDKFGPTNLEVIFKRELLFPSTINPDWLAT